jgi:hypothetical protein
VGATIEAIGGMLMSAKPEERKYSGAGSAGIARKQGNRCSAVGGISVLAKRRAPPHSLAQSVSGVAMRWVRLVWFGLTLCLGSATAFAQQDASFSTGEDDNQSNHEGYYYPKPQTVEHFVSAVVTLPESDQTRRQAFVIGMTQKLLDGKYAPGFAIFAKGNKSEKLIVVGMIDGQLNTLFRARALLAELTAIARSTTFFQQNTQPEASNFFDFMKLLGFHQITITDGRDFAHQVIVD